MATVKLFEHLLQLEKHPDKLDLRNVRTNIPREVLDSLPEQPGVYYFYDEHDRIIYIGKSVNIRHRVISHLNNNTTKRAIEMMDQIRNVSYELTGNDLIAQLLESNEIKKHKPLFNRSLRRSDFNYGLFSYTGQDGYIHLKIERIRGERLPLTAYSSAGEGRNHLHRLVIEHELCMTVSGLYDSSNGCFNYHLGACHGACVGKESPDEYNNRVIDAISRYTGLNKNFFILDEGRNADELSVVKVENGRFIGFGYVGADLLDHNTSLLHEVIRRYEDNKDVQVIIKGYLRKNNFEKVMIY
jgi:DNA polymerase-3 subunit epsilon